MEHQSPNPKLFSVQSRMRGYLQPIASLSLLHLFALFIALQTTHWIWVLIGLLVIDLGLFFFYRETLKRARRVTNLKFIQQRTEYRFAGVLFWRRSTSTFMGTDKATGQDIVLEPPIPPFMATIVVGLLTLIALGFDWVTIWSFLQKGVGVIGHILMTAIAIGLTWAATHFIGCIIRDRKLSLQ